MGSQIVPGNTFSDAVAEKIDVEIALLLDRGRARAKQALAANRERLTLLANRLIVDETLEGAELNQILDDVSAEENAADLALTA